MWNFPVMPEQASEHAPKHDALFWTISALLVIFSILVYALIVYLVMKYRKGSPASRANPVHDSKTFEMTFTVIPTILALIVFGWGTKLYVEMRDPPKDCMEIFVIGKQWMWHIQHPNGVRENNTLHVPVGRNVKLIMISQDVIHGFYIPAFRIQYHVVPGRYTEQWFKATKPGKYNLFCSLHCGTQHSEMGGYVYVLTQQEYAEWLANQGKRTTALSMVDKGKEVYEQLACGNCHGSVDSPRGPSLNGIFGTERAQEDGSKQLADEAYLRESMLAPYRHLTKGYRNTMPTYSGSISEENILSLIEYVKSLGKAKTAPMPTATPTTTPNPAGRS